VTLQENNALAIIDIRRAKVKKLVGLGNKDHSKWRNSLDASDRDDAINIKTWPVLGTYMPDSIASFSLKGRTYLVTANEGDSREYAYDATEEACEAAGHIYDDGDCFSHIDEARVKDVVLDPSVFPNTDFLQEDENIGRLKMLTTEGKNADGEYKEIHSFGARSITIWDSKGRFVSDSGNMIEKKTAKLLPDYFNSTNDENDSFDNRSDDKGPEPEGVVVGKVGGSTYAFVGLERVGGIMVFDVTNPKKMRFVDYINNRNFDPNLDVEGEIEAGNNIGDFGPEGLAFIDKDDSPNGRPLLVVGNEVSGTTTIYEIEKIKRRKRDDDDDDNRKSKRGRDDDDHDDDDDDD